MERWLTSEGKVEGFFATTMDGKQHYTSDLDNDIPIFSVMTELNLTLAAHRTKNQVRIMRSEHLYARIGSNKKDGRIQECKKQPYLVLNDETLYEYKK